MRERERPAENTEAHFLHGKNIKSLAKKLKTFSNSASFFNYAIMSSAYWITWLTFALKFLLLLREATLQAKWNHNASSSKRCTPVAVCVGMQIVSNKHNFAFEIIIRICTDTISWFIINIVTEKKLKVKHKMHTKYTYFSKPQKHTEIFFVKKMNCASYLAHCILQFKTITQVPRTNKSVSDI